MRVDMNKDIKSLSIEELQELLGTWGMPKFRATQLFEGLHKKQVTDYNEITNVPKAMIHRLEEFGPVTQAKIVTVQKDSADQTQKVLFALSDGQLVEAVLMSYRYGYSLCISSQIGCRMGCDFCASTRSGLTRQLSASEMLEQVYAVERYTGEPISRIVVMGTGEPFDNYDAFVQFVRLISHEKGRNLSRRHITVSTCGLVPKILELAKDLPQVNLAISLHSPYQNKREQLMPVAKAYDLEQLIAACRSYIAMTNRRITFEYALIEGDNDREEDAKALAALLDGLLCHVNLIPVNPVDHRDQKATDERHSQRFYDILNRNHVQVTIRRSLGREIDAACGQLRNRYMDENNNH